MKKIQKPKKIAAIVAAVIVGLSLQAHARYNQPSNFNGLRKVSINKGSSLNSVRNAINNNPNGVVITLKKGWHNWSNTTVEMPRNVHFRFEGGVTVNRGGFRLIGGNNSIVGPVKIKGPTPSNTNDPLGTRYQAVGMDLNGTVNNFLLDKLTIDNKWTWGQSIGINASGINGTIQNIKSINNPPGYGLTQLQGGQNLVFNNLDSTGGFGLRLEQTSASRTYRGRISLTANNVICRNGRAAVYLLPAIANGAVTVNRVRAYSCAWAVEGGSKDGGNFSSARITDIAARYGTKMQTKAWGYGIPKTRDFIPDGLKSQSSSVPNSQGGVNGKFITGPSLGCIFFGNRSWASFGNARRWSFPSAYSSDPIRINSDNIRSVASSR